MTWPQLYVLAGMIIAVTVGIATESRDPKRTTWFIVFYVFFRVAFTVATALVLHAGGFW